MPVYANLSIPLSLSLRFAEDHKDENMIKQKVIADLPMYLKKELVRHLYQRQYARRVPVFSLLTGLDPAVCPDAQDIMDEIFLGVFGVHGLGFRVEG